MSGIIVKQRDDAYFRYHIPKTITVQVDTREQRPVLFPSNITIPHPEVSFNNLLVKVKVKNTALPCGDYRLKEYPESCVIERKAAQLELFKNVIEHHDSIRQARSFRKLAECEFPYVLIEASPAEILTVNEKVKNPDAIIFRLSLALIKYGLHVLWIPWGSRSTEQRRKLGTIMLHLMLACAIHRHLDVLPELLDKSEEIEDEEVMKARTD